MRIHPHYIGQISELVWHGMSFASTGTIQLSLSRREEISMVHWDYPTDVFSRPGARYRQGAVLTCFGKNGSGCWEFKETFSLKPSVVEKTRWLLLPQHANLESPNVGRTKHRASMLSSWMMLDCIEHVFAMVFAMFCQAGAAHPVPCGSLVWHWVRRRSCWFGLDKMEFRKFDTKWWNLWFKPCLSHWNRDPMVISWDIQPKWPVFVGKYPMFKATWVWWIPKLFLTFVPKNDGIVGFDPYPYDFRLTW